VQSTDTSQLTTGAPQAASAPLHLAPRPVPPVRPLTAVPAPQVVRHTNIAGKVVITTAHPDGDPNGFTHTVATYRPTTQSDIARNDGYGTEGELTLIEDAGFYTALDADRDHTATVTNLTPPAALWPTDADVDHALGAWGDYDRWNTAADAFGQGPDGAA
jgi:hypothetical protein